MENDISKKRFLLGSYGNISSLFKLADENGLFAQIEQTVFMDNPLVHFVAGNKSHDEQKEGLENVLAYMQPTFNNSMQPYEVDREAAQHFYAHIVGYLKKVKPNIEVVLTDISGKLITGEASNIRGDELLVAGVPCYCPNANPIQVTVMEDKKEAIYAMKLPAKPHSEIYAVAKTSFPSQKVLGQMEGILEFFEENKDMINN